MGYFLTQMLALIVRVFFKTIYLFLEYIDLCDALLVTFFVWVIMIGQFKWNGWWSLALGAVVALILFAIFKHPIGFWIVTPIFSAIWAFLAVGLMVRSIFPDIPELLLWIGGIAFFAWVISLHDYAINRAYTTKLLEEEERAKSRNNT